MKLKFRALFTVMMMLSCCCVAQNQNAAVRITVKNEKKENVQNATVKVLHAPDSSLFIVKTLKGNDVFFSLKKNTTYFLQITSVTINDAFRTIRIGNADTTINIITQTKSSDLAAVTVTARKPLVTQQDDKTIVDAEVLASSSTNAYEVLEKTPGAIVDQDGNVYLNSQSPATIYINGREVKLSSSDLASLLKSLPANSISKIEILRSPSAKYDASSSGGIVNIVLKKGVKLGLNGSVEYSHYQGKYPTNSFGFSLNNNANKLNSYLSGNITRRTNYEYLTSERPVNHLNFIQSSYTRYPNLNNYIGGGLDYEINKKWSIGYDGRLVANQNKSYAQNIIDQYYGSMQTHVGSNISYINNTGPSTYFGNNFSSKFKIDSLGSEWENSLDINFSRATNDQNFSNTYFLPAAGKQLSDGNSQNNRNTFAFKSDLVLKTKAKYTIETGTKLSFSSNKNKADFTSDNGAGRFYDTVQSNNFRYKENIAAAYVQVAKTFFGFTMKPGLRLEYTDISGHQLYPNDTVFQIKRTDLFPYVYLRHDIAKLFGFKLVGNALYRRSISRPSYDQLNPYAKRVDQYTTDIGNPTLKPQFTTNYEFNITAEDFPIITVGLNQINDIFNSLTYQKDTVLYRTFDNLGHNKEIYLRFAGGIPPGKKYFFYMGAQMNAVDYDGIYGNAPFAFKKTSWTFFMYHNYKPIPTLNLSLNGFMRTNSVINFFELKKFGGLTFAANKSILKRKMNVVVSVNDIFRTNRNEFTINVPGFTGSGMRYGDTRRVGVTLKYNFGIKPKKEESKENYETPAQEGN